MGTASPLEAICDGLTGLGHPIRVRALVLLETEQAPKALADTLGEPLGVTSYHVRMMVKYGLATLARTEPRRGALQHYYVRTELGNTLLRELAKSLELPPLRGRGAFANRAELLAEWAGNGNGQVAAAA